MKNTRYQHYVKNRINIARWITLNNRLIIWREQRLVAAQRMLNKFSPEIIPFGHSKNSFPEWKYPLLWSQPYYKTKYFSPLGSKKSFKHFHFTKILSHAHSHLEENLSYFFLAKISLSHSHFFCEYILIIFLPLAKCKRDRRLTFIWIWRFVSFRQFGNRNIFSKFCFGSIFCKSGCKRHENIKMW